MERRRIDANTYKWGGTYVSDICSKEDRQMTMDIAQLCKEYKYEKSDGKTWNYSGDDRMKLFY